MLHLKHITSRSNTCELRVKSICRQLVLICSSLESFARAFEHDINKLPRVNTSHCSDWYKLVDDTVIIQLWHKNVLGDLDRLVLEITDDGVVAADPFNF